MLAFKSATELVAMLRGAQISAAELLDRVPGPRTSIRRQNQFDHLAGTERETRSRAMPMQRSPLAGLPMTVKEAVRTRRIAHDLGHSKSYATTSRDADSVVVERLRAAGATLFGKTNVPLNLGDFQSYNAIYGTTNNPWDHGTHPRWLVGRFRGRARRRLDRARDGLGHRWFHPQSGALLRRVRPQTHVQTRAAAAATHRQACWPSSTSLSSDPWRVPRSISISRWTSSPDRIESRPGSATTCRASTVALSAT